MSHPHRPFPWRLLSHWFFNYLLIWSLLALLIFIVQLVLAFVLHDREDVSSFLKLLDKMPPIFKAFIGGDKLMAGNVQSIVAIGYQHPLVLTLLMINAATTPTGLLTAQVEKGTMEILLARPITRSRVYGLTALLSLGGQAGLVLVLFLGTATWTRVFDYGEQVPLGGFIKVSANLIFLACAVCSLSILAAVWFNERNRAIGLIVGYLVVSYLLDFAAAMLPRLDAFHPYSLFNYCRPLDVLRAGQVPLTHFTVLGSITLISLTLGWAIWRKRDLYAA